MIEALKDVGISITSPMITSTVITIIIAAVVIFAGRHMEMIPSGLQNVMEIVVEKLHGFFLDLMGPYAGRKYFPIVATLFIYVLLCNYSGLLPMAGHMPGLAAPTSSINFPAALAVIVFLATQIIGMRENHGIRYFKHMFKPFVFLFPLMLLDEFVRPLSLTFRLYGNIYGEEKVVESFFGLVPIALPVVMQLLSVLMGLIQALVFALLAGIYISGAAEHHGEETLDVAH